MFIPHKTLRGNNSNHNVYKMSIIIEQLLCAGYHSKDFMWVKSFVPSHFTGAETEALRLPAACSGGNVPKAEVNQDSWMMRAPLKEERGSM